LRILVKESGSIIADLAFEQRQVDIGSARECGVHLPDFRVAGCHATLVPCDDGRWHFRQNEEGHNTTINGHISRGEVAVANGDQIVIGDYTLNLYLDLGEHHDPRADQVPQRKYAEANPLPPGAHLKIRRDAVTLPAAMLQDCATFANDLVDVVDVSEAIEKTVRLLLRRFGARAVWIGVRRHATGGLEQTCGRTFGGTMFDQVPHLKSLLPRCLDLGAAVVCPELANSDTHSFMAAPLSTVRGHLGLLYIDAKHSCAVLTEKDLDHLLALAAVIAARIESLYRSDTRRRQAVSAAESSVIQTIQDKLGMESIPEWPNLQVAIHTIPGAQRAGDIHDIMSLPNGAAAMIIGHVHAADVVAAVSLVEVRAAFRIAVLHADLPHVLVRELAWLLNRQVDRISMDCAVVMVDPRTGGYLYCIAGQAAVVCVTDDGNTVLLDRLGSPALGVTAHTEYRTRKGVLGEGASLVLYSPGALELCDSTGSKMSDEAMVESVADAFGMPARAMADNVVADLDGFRGDAAVPQDVTLIVAHRNGAGREGR
jgi:serine phosphatase RsbU (regulator of sigma subunit)